MKRKNLLDYLTLLFGILGLGAMIYLISSFSLNIISKNSCDIISSVINCSKVVTSNYSTLFGIEWYYYGIIFFALIIVLSLIGLFNRKERNRKYAAIGIFGLSVFGAAVACYLIYVELFLVHHICIGCTTGHIAIFSILIISIIRFAKYKNIF